DQTRVLDAQALEHRRWLKQLLQSFLHAVRGLVRRRADEREVAQQTRDVVLEPFVARVDAQLGQVSCQAADGRRVGTAVVVDDDDQVRRLQVRDLVQRLVG